MDVETMLTDMERDIARARTALADEHEGDLRAAALSLNTTAVVLAHLVTTW